MARTNAFADANSVESKVLAAVNNAHWTKYDVMCNNALAGYIVLGTGYGQTEEAELKTWLDFKTVEDKKYITGYYIEYNGRRHSYATPRGWLRTMNRLTHRTMRAYRTGKELGDTREEITP